MPQTETIAPTRTPRTNLPVLAFFWSTTDGPSRRMDSVIDLLGRARRADLRLAKIEMHDRPDIGRRCNVSQVPTLVVLDNGVEIGRLEGRHSLPQLEQFVDSLVDSHELPMPNL